MTSIDLNKVNLDKVKLSHIRHELNGYYTGDDLDRHVVETYSNFQQAGANPLHFQFIEETRFNENEFKTETWLGWKLKGADYGSVFIKD